MVLKLSGVCDREVGASGSTTSTGSRLNSRAVTRERCDVRTITEGKVGKHATIPRGDDLPAQPPVHPGEVLLEEFLKPMGLTQTEAAQRMSIPIVRMNELVNGRRGVTADTALRLAGLLGTTPQFWLNMQAEIDLYEARRKQLRRESQLA